MARDLLSSIPVTEHIERWSIVPLMERSPEGNDEN